MELGWLLWQKQQQREDTDVVFEIGPDSCIERFEAHKVVLSARSPVLAVELRGGFREAGELRIRVPDVDAAAFSSFLAFVYLDEVRFPEGRDSVDCLMQLAALADRYDVNDSRKALVESLRGLISWGKNVGQCLSQLLVLPPGSQRRKELLEVCSEKMRSMHYVPHFDAEMRALGNQSTDALRAKSFILETVMSKSAKAKYSTKRDGSLYPGSGSSLVDSDLAERMAQELRGMTEGWEDLVRRGGGCRDSNSDSGGSGVVCGSSGSASPPPVAAAAVACGECGAKRARTG